MEKGPLGLMNRFYIREQNKKDPIVYYDWIFFINLKDVKSLTISEI